ASASLEQTYVRYKPLIEEEQIKRRQMIASAQPSRRAELSSPRVSAGRTRRRGGAGPPSLGRWSHRPDKTAAADASRQALSAAHRARSRAVGTEDQRPQFGSAGRHTGPGRPRPAMAIPGKE